MARRPNAIELLAAAFMEAWHEEPDDQVAIRGAVEAARTALTTPTGLRIVACVEIAAKAGSPEATLPSRLEVGHD